MKLSPIGRYLMIESRIDFLKEKNPHISDKRFNILQNLDPTENKRYLQWLVNQYNKTLDTVNGMKVGTDRTKDFFATKVGELRKALRRYHTLTTTDTGVLGAKHIKKDINAYNVSDLLAAMDGFNNADIRSRKEKEKEYDIIIEKPKCVVIVPRTEAASVKLGRGTTWCTTYDGVGNQFRLYDKKGSLYIIVDRTEKEEGVGGVTIPKKFQFFLPAKRVDAQIMGWATGGELAAWDQKHPDRKAFNKHYDGVLDDIMEYVMREREPVQKKQDLKIQRLQDQKERILKDDEYIKHLLSQPYVKMHQIKQNMEQGLRLTRDSSFKDALEKLESYVEQHSETKTWDVGPRRKVTYFNEQGLVQKIGQPIKNVAGCAIYRINSWDHLKEITKDFISNPQNTLQDVATDQRYYPMYQPFYVVKDPQNNYFICNKDLRVNPEGDLAYVRQLENNPMWSAVFQALQP